MKADCTGTYKGITASYRKHDKFRESYIGIVIDDAGNTLHDVVTLRLYRTEQTAHCCVFVNSPDYGITATGSGKAGGCGYPTTYGIGVWLMYNPHIDKDVEAVGRIIAEAGLEFYNEFSDKRWVYRFKISKAKENLAKIKKYRDRIKNS